MKKFRYKSLFIYTTPQSVGHLEEYFIKNTEKLVQMIIFPKPENNRNIVRLYHRAKFVKEQYVPTSQNKFLYYFYWYITYLYILFKYFSSKEKFIVLSGHPLLFFGMGVQKMFRKNITFVFWIGDYFPPNNIILYLFERVKKYYHDRIPYSCYLSDRMNQAMNGTVLNTRNRKTIMWGVKQENIFRNPPKKNIKLLFVGLIRPSQGIELAYSLLRDNKNYSLKVIGFCDNRELYLQYTKIIQEYKIQDRIFFPNRFFTDEELNKESLDCHIGIALYHTSNTNAEYYGDPGKIKTYTELGLPIIISNTTVIIPYIRKYKCGEAIKRTEKSLKVAIEKIKNNYSYYTEGVKNFNDYFDFEKHYAKKFIFLESI